MWVEIICSFLILRIAKVHMKSDQLQHFVCLLDKMNIFTLLRVKINYLPRTEKRMTHEFSL